MNNFHLYDSKGQKDLPILKKDDQLNDPKRYIPSNALVDAVNVALALGQPLMLTGKPGTGKTQLAFHVAHFFKLGKVLRYNAQTTSTKKDLFYRYDALAHFQYNQTSTTPLTPDEIEEKFITYNALGEAIKANSRRLVLIDEIDKAPRDLPNNVLAAIEDLEFDVPEIGKSYKADDDNRPVIIITSNSEKNLPDAFLRRVIYYDIPFPSPEMLLTILNSKFEGSYTTEQLQAAIQHFNDIRDDKTSKLKKEPATAELIFWVQLLKKINFDVSKLTDVNSLGTQEKETLKMTYSVLAKNREDLQLLKDRLGEQKRRRRR